MSWIAITACTLIAALYLYRYLSSSTKKSYETVATSVVDTIEHNPADKSQPDVLDIPTVAPEISLQIDEPPSPMESDSKQYLVMTSSNEDREPKQNGITMAPPSLPIPKPTNLSASMSPPRLKPPVIGPVPPRPGGASLRPPPSAASTLRVPPQKVLQNTSMQPASLAPNGQKKASRQVALEPGHSPMDWAALTADPNNKLRGKDAPTGLSRITPSQLKSQNGRKGSDAWTVYQGKVYNISPYVPFHPGGKGEILRGAGKDSAKLFMEVHPWVNWDGMLAECMVGILVGEEEMQVSNDLDEMD